MVEVWSVTRTILCPVLVVLLLALRGGPAVAVERVLPLGPAEVSELAGTAWVVRPSQPQAPLAKGQRLTEMPRIETAAQARLELRFADGRRPVTPPDVLASMVSAMGIDPRKYLRDGEAIPEILR